MHQGTSQPHEEVRAEGALEESLQLLSLCSQACSSKNGVNLMPLYELEYKDLREVDSSGHAPSRYKLVEAKSLEEAITKGSTLHHSVTGRYVIRLPASQRMERL